MLKQSFIKSHGKSGLRTTSELPVNFNDTMEDFVRETKKALWHVFQSLDKNNDDCVPTSQLKVITSNVGMKLGFDKAEQFLDKEGLTTLGYGSYMSIIDEHMFGKLGSSVENGQKCYGELLNDALSVCWAFCNFKSSSDTKALNSEHGFKLWRLFNFLCEVQDNGAPVLPMVIHKEEVGFLFGEFITTTGQRTSEQAVRQIVEGDVECFSFTEFMTLFERDCLQHLIDLGISQGLTELYEMVILDVLKKGMMAKRGHNVKSWKDRWLVLTPKSLKYYASPSEKQLKGSIVFDIDCSIELLPDRSGHKPNRFVVHTSRKPYEMSAADLKTKNEWVSAFQLAIDNAGSGMHLQREKAKQRRAARADARKLMADEMQKRLEEAELLKQRQDELDAERKKRLADEALLLSRLGELEEERKRRADAEARYQEEQLLREAEQQRLRELEAIKQELERLLEEERQAKKDEEIVRALQAKILEEEFQRREELEKLKQEQDALLLAEREQKAVLESDREEQRRRLQEAQNRLDQLEKERQSADEKLQEASDKLCKAEKDRVVLEEKARLWKKPVGLARPVGPTINPHLTHRGEGAFCESDFQKGTSVPARATEDFFLRKLRERAEKANSSSSSSSTRLSNQSRETDSSEVQPPQRESSFSDREEADNSTSFSSALKTSNDHTAEGETNDEVATVSQTQEDEKDISVYHTRQSSSQEDERNREESSGNQLPAQSFGARDPEVESSENPEADGETRTVHKSRGYVHQNADQINPVLTSDNADGLQSSPPETPIVNDHLTSTECDKRQDANHTSTNSDNLDGIENHSVEVKPAVHQSIKIERMDGHSSDITEHIPHSNGIKSSENAVA